MRPVITAEQMREAERPYLEAGVDLMSVAAGAVAHEAGRILASRSRLGRIVVAAGPGNNGGDGLFAAAMLARRHSVAIFAISDKLHDAALAAALEAGCRRIDAVQAIAELENAALVIDAVLGLGARPGLSDELATFAEACAALRVPVVSVDLPSGLDPDSHAEHTCFAAHTTVTFAARKLCHVATPAAAACGRVVVADIGVELPETRTHVLGVDDLQAGYPFPDHLSDKYSRGVVGLDTGSATYPGAALLGCAGALHAGAGMVRYLGDADQVTVVAAHPSLVTAEGRVQAMVVGSGWGGLDVAAARLRAAAELDVPLVIDADALPVLRGIDLPANSLLTPHAGELARLLGVERAEVESDPIESARRAAAEFGATVLLKGATQYVVTNEETYIAYRGPSWTGQAGSGDVLAGICGTLLAAGLPAWKAGALGASLQALTAERYPGPYPPDVLISRAPAVIAELAANSDRRDAGCSRAAGQRKAPPP